MKKRLLLLFACFLLSSAVFAQKGRIIRAATTSVMDPNQDGFVSQFATGFSDDGYAIDEFEIKMFGIPQVDGDVAGDNVGAACGITDLTPDSKGYSSYAVLDGNNLIFRFRVGDDNPSVESWSILLDTDGRFGAADPNSTGNNPGFEVDITLIKRNNAGVYVYNIDGTSGCPTPVLSYPIASNFQISIADVVTCGDPDYFYDFYVPFNQLAAQFGISTASGLRFVAVANVSATCAMSGNIADVAGVNNDVAPYAGCVTCAFSALVDNQCPTAIDDLCQTCGGFEKDKVNKPSIDTPVRAGQRAISGTTCDLSIPICAPNVFIKVEIYSRIGGTDIAPVWSTTPRETASNTAVGTLWTVALAGELQTFDKIVAWAQKDINSVPCATAGGNLASAEVTVVEPNTRPIATNQNLTTPEDVARNITLTATDAENDPLVFTVATPPSHGVISGSGASLVYTPNGNYFGPDSFTFQAYDGVYFSTTAGTITIDVTPVNDAPVATNLPVTTPEDTPKAITLPATDVEGTTLTYSIVNGPAHGSLSTITGAVVTYTPGANYNGTDSFTFKASDGSAESNVATVNITISPVQDPPVADSQSIIIDEDVVTPIELKGSDADNEAITFRITLNPGHGTLTGSGANWTYKPDADYNGPDKFEFVTNDGHVDSNPVGVVTITINPVNDPPIAKNKSYNTNEDQAVATTLEGTDVDGDALTYTIVAQPKNGTLSGSGAAITYTPNSNYNGADDFTYTVTDIHNVTSNIATVSIAIAAVNDPPVANNVSVTTDEDTPKGITLVASDPEGGPLTYSIVTPPTHGSLSTISGATLTYTPNPNYNGPDAFVYRASDGSLFSNNANVSITVNSVNDVPVATPQSLTTNEDTALPITLSGTDADGNPLTFEIMSSPSNGSLGTLTGAAVTYTPAANYNGGDSFTFRVKDNQGGISANATISITVTPVNDAPVAANLSVSTDEDVAKSITLSATDAEGSTLTYSIVTPPSHGSLSAVVGTGVTYTPAPNYNGPDAFVYRASDGSLFSNNATVSITVNSINDIPIATAQTLTTNEDTALPITLSGTDADGNPLTFEIMSAPTHGSLGTLAGAAVTYTPAANYNGGDSFQFRVKDNQGGVSTNATISITVTPVNDPPVAADQNVSTDEDVARNITLAASDVEGSTLTYSIVTPPAHGSFTITGTLVRYTPAANYNGTDFFTFRANDGSANSNTATVSITINAINDAPIANSQSKTYLLDTPEPVTLTGSDVEGSALTFTIVTPPAHGFLGGSGASVIYNPDPGFTGSDIFTFKVSDGSLESNIATVSMFLLPGSNVPPTADNQSGITVVEDTPKTIVLTASDANGDALSYTLVSPPSHGSVTISGANALYSPALNYNGPDAFTFKANDGSVNSADATISLTVTPVNDAPVADDQNISLAEDTPTLITFTGSDVESDPLTFSIVTPPAHGGLTGSGNSRTYTPTGNYKGPDSFTFKANDGQLDSDPATVTIVVTSVNDLPVADAQAVSTDEDIPLSITLTGSDVDLDALTYTVTGNPAHGTLSGVAPNLTYTPAANYNGPDAFQFKVNDGTGDSAPATISITVNAINDKPVATAQNVNVPEDTPTLITVAGTDIENSPLTFSIVSQPSHGSLTGSGPGFTYTPAGNYNGPDAFSFKANDGQLDSDPATVTIVVTPINDLPVAAAQNLSTDEDVMLSVTLGASDADFESLTYSVVGNPAHGTLSGAAPNLTYTPALNYNGPDAFTFKANDGHGDSNTATITLTVNPINDPPVVDAQTLSTPENIALPITLTGSDIDGDAITFSIVTPPTKGSLSGSGANITYTPTHGFVGTDNFTFKGNDGTVDSAPATITIGVTFVNELPVANNQTVFTNEDVVLNITLTATDSDLDPLTYTVVGTPAHGTLTGTAPNLTYTPALNYNGPDALTFTVNDGTGDSNIATVSIGVTAVNDRPQVQSQPITTPEDVAVSITLIGSDPDGDALTWTVLSVPLHGTLSGTAPNLTYTPNPDYNGSDNFTFRANDGIDNSNVGVVAISVTPVDDPPTAFNQSGGGAITTPENVPKAIVIVGTDPDGDNLTYIIVTPPAHGTLTGTGPNQTYTPDHAYTGDDHFEFKVNDGNTDSNVATVSITVTPVTSPPVADSQTISVDEDSAISFNLTAKDVDGDALTYTVLSQVTKGSLTGSPPSLIYLPSADYNGPDKFTFKAYDGSHDSNTATVSIIVKPVNDAPILAPIPDFIMPEDSTIRICLGAIDVDGDVINYRAATNKIGGGTMVLAAAPFDFCYNFTPAKNYTGVALWQMNVADPAGLTASTDVKITITPRNDAPNAVDDAITVMRHVATEGNVLTNDFDVDGDPLAVTITPITSPQHGEITFSSNGAFTYISERSYRGPDAVEYEVCDNAKPALCSRAVLNITIEDDPFRVYEGVTPNGDGSNDYLRIDGIDYYTENVVRIFDRFQNLVFEMSGYDNEENVWRGQANRGLTGGGLPEGTYFYLIELGDGESPKRGFVVLKRN